MDNDLDTSNSQSKSGSYAQLGINICGILNIGFAFLVIIKTLYFFIINNLMIGTVPEMANLRNLLLIQDLILFCALVLSAVGLLMRKTWGWWVTVIFYAYAILDSAFSVSVPFMMDLKIPYTLPYIIVAIVPKVIVIVVCTVLLIYLLTKNVREVFKTSISLFKTVLILLGAGVLLQSIIAVLTIMMFKK